MNGGDMKKTQINRRKFLNAIASSGIAMMTTTQFACSNHQDDTRNQEKPNVILVMTDDQGYGELSIHGNPILRTPNLDTLARQSIRFSDFHVAPMCAPTRSQLLTGLDAVRTGTINVSSGRSLLRPELPTMADFFAENGYATGIFGKWHLGGNYPFRPQDRGFQESLWFPSSHISSVPDYWGNDYYDDTYIHNGKREKFKGYCTDIFFDEAKKFINKSVKNGKPFFAYIPTNTPHSPLIAHEEDIEAVEKLFEESDMTEKDVTKKGLITYLAMCRNIDTNMGELRNYLEKNELDKNTIIIFLTDNGSTFAPFYYEAGMKGMKTQLWEGGHRVPLFIHYPNGHFTETRQVEGLTQVQDILPTLMDLCQLKTAKPSAFDGISLLKQLKQSVDAPEDRMLVINYSRMPMGFNYPSVDSPAKVTKDDSAVLWKRWRLLENRELFNLDTDPKQQTNVIDQHPEIAKKMRDYLDFWWDGVKENANDIQRIIIGNEKENPMMLTACEWIDVFVDQQYQIRRGVKKHGYWKLVVDRPGKYEFELRRWPREINVPLSGNLENCRQIGISQARVYIDGVYHPSYVKKPWDFRGRTKIVKPEDVSVTFTYDLKKGPITLHTWLDDEENEPVFGAYYVYVKRLEG